MTPAPDPAWQRETYLAKRREGVPPKEAAECVGLKWGAGATLQFVQIMETKRGDDERLGLG